ncbi:hypothetical protein N0V94_004478 [Neodidymelliopsis sp. IMI 364377]|nr:hypothetical protein N0V94_004478 [Neodidymelliopsis sp. IMI 364377]
MAARTAPEHQSKLIVFLYLLRSITLKNPDSDELWEVVKGEGVVWKDLPTFGYTIADEMGSFDGQETEYTQEEAQKWENLTAFFAQIDASTSESPSPLNFTHSWALTALAWAFEGGGDSGEPSELAIRLACIWLVYDAQKLWSETVDAQAETINRERWDMWRQGLMESRLRCGNGTTPMLIDHALAQMQQVSDAA